MEPTEEELIKIAKPILADLEDRRGVGNELEGVRYSDRETYREIQVTIGRLAWESVRDFQRSRAAK